MQRVFPISRSRSGLPCIGVGGGALTSRTKGRFVIRRGQLAPAIFVRRGGHLACSMDQAVVPLREGDIIVEVYGRRPVDPNNPDIRAEAYWVPPIPDGAAEIRCEPAPAPDIFRFETVVRALGTYHNRDGAAFVRPREEAA